MRNDLFGIQQKHEISLLLTCPSRICDAFPSSRVHHTLHKGLSSDGSNANDIKRHLKKQLAISFVLLDDYFSSLDLYANGELLWNQIGKSTVKVKK